MSLFEDLRTDAAAEWEAYTRHDFVEQLGAGTLPLEAFQDYLVQDYLFLVQFARANALAASRSRRLSDIRRSADALGAILAPRLDGRQDHPYRDWIAEYAGTPFQRAAREAIDHLDTLATRSLTEHRYAELVTVFRTATRLEAGFWQQALDRSSDSGRRHTRQ